MWSAVVGRLGRMCPCLLRLWRDPSGNALVMFALSSMVVMLSVGAAIDIGRWLLARDETLAAVDAAVLAGARTLQTSDDAAAIATAQAFYQQNIQSRLPVTSDTISFAVVDGGQAMIARGSAAISTLFMRFAHVDTLPLVPTASAEIAKAEYAIGGNSGDSGGGGSGSNNGEVDSLEVSLMLDVTGSMGGQKLDDLKAAAADLANIVLWQSNGLVANNSRIALVPFSEDIRLPTTSALLAARGSGLPSSKTLTNGYGWPRTYYLTDCVVERTGTEKYTDAVPGAGQYVMAHYSDKTTWSGGNKQGKCTIPEGSEVVPLTDDKTSLIAKIQGLSASGGTAGHLGTVWAWYTLSPSWASLWPAESQPKPYGTAGLEKIAILMTDGEYNTEYDSNGVRVGSTGAGAPANDTSTAQARALCSAMKQEGITIYTIGFALSGATSESYQTLAQCASDEHKFYSVADGDELKNAFRDIAIKISKPLVLSK